MIETACLAGAGACFVLALIEWRRVRAQKEDDHGLGHR